MRIDHCTGNDSGTVRVMIVRGTQIVTVFGQAIAGRRSRQWRFEFLTDSHPEFATCGHQFQLLATFQTVIQMSFDLRRLRLVQLMLQKHHQEFRITIFLVSDQIADSFVSRVLPAL